MAIGDDATLAGYPLVPPTGNEGLVKWGSREINRTRDYVAQVKGLVPTSKDDYRKHSGISSGFTDPPSSGAFEGDIYFKIVG